jgi:hypothetical protein
MLNAGNSIFSLVIVSIGILGVVISFLIADKKKYLIALVLSLAIVSMGAVQFVNSSLSRWRTARRISMLQQTQRLNLEALQARLREAAEKSRKPGTPSPVTVAPRPSPAPVPTPTVVKKRK